VNKDSRKWWTLGTVCFALLMIVLDGNVVNLAIPSILKDFGATMSQIEWVNNAYLLTFAVFLITFGRLGDEIGRKKMFIGGLIAFVIGSVLCGIANDINQLILFRVVQGLGGAAMMPATISLIAANFEKKERGSAMGIWGAVAGLGIVLGPIIGGYLTDKGLGSSLNNFFNISELWRYVFYINVPIGVLALISALRFIPESKDHERTHRFDILGIILSAIAVFFLTFGFIEGAKYGWWTTKESFAIFGQTLNISIFSIIPVFFAVAVIAGALFILVEKKCKKDPLVDLKLFKRKNFSVGNITTSILSFGMMGSFFLLPLFLQIVMGFAPIKTGQVLMPFAITIMIMAPISGKLADKIGGKFLVSTGLLIMAAGAFLLGRFQVNTEIKDLILPFIVMGIGMGLTQAPLTNISLLETPEDEVGGASGVLSTARQIGSVMGIAILGAFLQTILATKIETNVNNIAGLPDSAKTLIVKSIETEGLSEDNSKMETELKKSLANSAGAGIPTVNLSTLTPDQLVAIKAEQTATQNQFAKISEEVALAAKKSFVDSINETFKVAALIALLGVLSSLFFRNSKGSEIKAAAVEIA